VVTDSADNPDPPERGSMDNFFSRYKNPLVLVAVLFIQVIALATQVKRAANPKASNPPETPLIRVWAVTVTAPVERTLVSTGHFFRNTWHNYIDLHNVRRQNLELQDELARLKLEQTRLREDAGQAQRLQKLLEFKQHYVGDVMPAQVVGTSGSEHSRLIYIDRGSHAGLRPDMAVITPDGIVGKVKDVTAFSSSVLMINDRESGAGVILEKSRRQGVLRGTAGGELNLSDIMSDENIEAGERVVTSGGDRIYPKGLPVGTVSNVAPDREDSSFLAIKIKPAADLNRLEEVLVVTSAEQVPVTVTEPAPQRAADILAERLPSVPKTDAKTDANPAKATPGANRVPAAGAIKKPEAVSPGQAVPKTKPAAEQKLEATPSGDQQKKALVPAPVPPVKTATTGQAAGAAGQSPAGSAAVGKPKPAATPSSAGNVQPNAGPTTQKPKSAAAQPPVVQGAQPTPTPAAQKQKPALQTKKPAAQPSPVPATIPQASEAAKPEGASPAATPTVRPPQ
jgi:rod shape-determining protein MreC